MQRHQPHLIALFAFIVLVTVLLAGCAPAQAKVQPPVPDEPKILRPGKPQTAHKPGAEDDGLGDFHIDYSRPITPPQGCLDLRKRTGNPEAC